MRNLFAIAIDSRLIDHNRTYIPSTGADMPLDPLAKRFLAMMAAASSGDRSRPLRGRAPPGARETDAVRARRRDGGNRRSTAYCRARPAIFLTGFMRPQSDAGETLPGFVFFHGGGMVAGSIDTHDRIAAALAQTTGCRLVSVDYRLAPEHKFPAAIEDAIAATRWVSEQAASLGIDATKLVVGGDSAGATLAAVVCQDALAKRRAGDIGAMPDLSGARFRGNLAVARSVRRKPSARQGHAGSRPRRLSAGRRRPRRSQNFAAARREICRASGRHYPYRRIRSDAGRRQCLCGKAGGGGRCGRARLPRRHDP